MTWCTRTSIERQGCRSRSSAEPRRGRSLPAKKVGCLEATASNRETRSSRSTAVLLGRVLRSAEAVDDTTVVDVVCRIFSGHGPAPCEGQLAPAEIAAGRGRREECE